MIIFFWRCHSFGLVMAQITLCGVNRDIAFNRCKEEKEEDAQHDAHWLVYLVGIGGNLTVASGNVGKICRLLLSLIRRGSDGRLVS